MSVLDIGTAGYHADDTGDVPTLSSSIANILVRKSAAHAHAAHPRLGNLIERRETESFDLGDAVHAILLEGDDRIVEVDAPDWRTKAAKEERDAARAAGGIPMLISQADRCRAMVAMVRRQLEAFDVDPPVLDPAGRPEVPIVWEESGVRCRALIDWLHPVGLEVPTVDDVKTTGGNGSPEVWSRGAVYSFGYDVQAAFHSRGVRALTGSDRVDFRFVVIEAEPPFEVAVYRLGADVLAVAEAKVDHAIEVWKRGLESGRWPGYPKRVGTLELPPWEEARWLEREMRDE